MSQLIVYILMRLVVVCCVGLGVTLALARREELRSSSIITRERCAIPCTFGIVPGTTERGDAQRSIERLTNGDYILSNDQRLSFRVSDWQGRAVAGILTFGFMQNQRVSSINLFKIDTGADLGQLRDLLLAGYRPQRVFRSCDGMTPRRMLMTFGIENRLVVELELGVALQPLTPITVLDVYAPNARTIGDTRASFGCSVETGWLGFAPLWKYYRTPSSG